MLQPCHMDYSEAVPVFADLAVGRNGRGYLWEKSFLTWLFFSQFDLHADLPVVVVHVTTWLTPEVMHSGSILPV